tara:strand:+ start:34 stop:303 length:270 start_codon:yes stop_codon:yes gene_type:complete
MIATSSFAIKKSWRGKTMAGAKINEFLHLKNNLYDLWSRMESHNGITSNEDLSEYVDMLMSMSRYYEKMGSEYKRRVELNKKLDEDKKI